VLTLKTEVYIGVCPLASLPGLYTVGIVCRRETPRPERGDAVRVQAHAAVGSSHAPLPDSCICASGPASVHVHVGVGVSSGGSRRLAR
jgi:hypothetical protein